MKIYHIF